MRYIMLVFAFVSSSYAASVCGEEFTYNLKDGATLSGCVEKFNPDKHDIRYIDNNSSKPIIAEIDGKIPFGIMPISVPETVLSNMELKIEDMIYKLDTAGMYNPGLPKDADGMPGKQIYVYCYGKSDCIVRMLLSDAATSYVAEWLVKYGVASRTVLTDQDDIVRQFVDGIAPPIFIDE